MNRRPSSICQLIKGKLIGAIDGFADSVNWVLSCFWHMKGDGVEVSGLDYGRPVLKITLQAGPGIRISRKGNGVWRIGDSSLDDPEAGDDANPSTATGGGGGPDSGGTAPTGTANGSGGGAGGAGSGGDGSGEDSGATDGTSCNTWSEEIENFEEDPGLENGGDDCDILNGW